MFLDQFLRFLRHLVQVLNQRVHFTNQFFALFYPIVESIGIGTRFNCFQEIHSHYLWDSEGCLMESELRGVESELLGEESEG